MKLIKLTETQYRNYSRIHNAKNFGQTIEYSMLQYNAEYKRILLGLIDESNNIHAATLLLIKNISPLIVEATAPDGFLIDYSNFELVRIFTEELKKYLRKAKITYLITNPMFKNRVINKNNITIEDNINILNNLYQVGFKSTGYSNPFERYDIIIENSNGIYDIYNNFNRNTKRNIKMAECLNIKLRKAKKEELEDSYNIFKKKTKNKLSYYQNLMSIYNNTDNKLEIFFAELNPHKYLINCQKRFELERENNEKIIKLWNKSLGNISESLFNKKILSDKALENRNQELKKAIALNQKTKDNIIIGTCITIKNNHEIYFLIDGYKEEYRHIYTTHILKWSIIKKYYQDGYRVFNLGEIHQNYQDKLNKFYNQYMYKIGFGGNIIEYPPNLLLVINGPIYNIFKK